LEGKSGKEPETVKCLALEYTRFGITAVCDFVAVLLYAGMRKKYRREVQAVVRHSQ
jgi:hypothetical protein